MSKAWFRCVLWVGGFLGLHLWWVACGNPTPTQHEDSTQQDASQESTLEIVAQEQVQDAAPTADVASPSEQTSPDTSTPETTAEPVSETPVSPEPPAQDTGPRKKVFGGTRPVTLQVPQDYDHSKPTPLLLILHGYGATGTIQSSYLGFETFSNQANVLIAAPNGTKDPTGKQFWNGTDACCDLAGSKVDDVAYLRGLLQEIKVEYNVDPKRIYFIGHSNGGFMSYRMACEAADQIAAIVSIAGATFSQKTKCSPSQPVSVLQIHGTADATVQYKGATIGPVSYPSAEQSVATWGEYNKCSGTLGAVSRNIDIESSIPGAETEIRSVQGCPTGIEATLWTIKGGSHIPGLVTDFASQVWQWMKAHPKTP